MIVNWVELQKALSPLKDYEDLCKRFRVSFSFPFIRQSFNFTPSEMIDFTHKLLGGDNRSRYTEYESSLVKIFTELQRAGIKDIMEFTERTASREKFQLFTQQSELEPSETITALKYLVYWFVPQEKYLSGLVKSDTSIMDAIKVLNVSGLRTNLELLQAGLTPDGRAALEEKTGLVPEVILDLVNRADFSRMPWSSKATISNIIGAGYGSIAQLADADPDRLYADFFNYGKRIGKNLKLGNEIENSYRIARIVPRLVK